MTAIEERSSNSQGKTFKNTEKVQQKHGNPEALKKRGRLIVRNIHFKASEKQLQEHFEEFGTLNEVKLLRKPDNSLVGCGFIQFDDVKCAKNAITNGSKKPFLGRPLVLDWAVPKNVYKNAIDQDVHLGKITMKPREGNDDEIFNRNFKKSKNQSSRKDFDANDGISTDFTSNLGNKSHKKKWKNSVNENNDSNSDADENSENKENPNKKFKRNSVVQKKSDDAFDRTKVKKHVLKTESDDSESKVKTDQEVSKKRVKEEYVPSKKSKDTLKNQPSRKKNEQKDHTSKHANDISEGLTVFLRNIPFSVNKEELKDFITTRYGPVYYAVICMDPATEHSRGTGFVKFRNKDSVNAILDAGEDLVLQDEVIKASIAVSKDELNDKKNLKPKGIKSDNRNLYLAKEGLILAGSNAAKGVSISDMNKRLSLESTRSRLLKKNLLMFVSDTRLVIYNLPPTYTDSKLKELFAKHSSKDAVIKEARVIKDNKKVNADGQLASREFGYVTFSQHLHALEALWNVNNNPDIFSKVKRPIVLFSIENRQAIATKLKRLEKSKKNNPTFKGEVSTKKQPKKDKNKNKAKLKKRLEAPPLNPATTKPYRGFVSAPGKNVLKSGFKIKKQALTHVKNVKKSKKLTKKNKKRKH